jgi:hypothetical protein
VVRKVFEGFRRYKGTFADEKYRKWWIEKHGGILPKLPSKEKIHSFEQHLDYYKDYEFAGEVTIAKNTIVRKAPIGEKKTEDCPAFFDEEDTTKPPKVYKYMLKYDTERYVFGSIEHATHDLICENLDEVFYAIVKGYELGDIELEETSKW